MTDHRCQVCGKQVPEWPRDWRFLDDGRAFCPDHKGELPTGGGRVSPDAD